MQRVNTIVEQDELPNQVKQDLGLTWEELIVEGARALQEVEG